MWEPQEGATEAPTDRAQAAALTTAEIAEVKNVRPSVPERIAARVSGPKPGSTACSPTIPDWWFRP